MSSCQRPAVSIGLAVFNGSKYIKQAIESILSQTFKNFELIISDNASTDSTQEICEKYLKQDSRIKYFKQPQNIGPIKNFEFVLDKAKAKYFMWFAADDLAKYSFIEELYSAIIAHPAFVLVMSDVENISDSDDHLYITELENIRIDKVERNWSSYRKLFFEVPISNIFFCIYGLYVTEIIRNVQLNYKGRIKYATASEIPILAQVSSYGMIGSIKGPLKIYRRHSESVYNYEQSEIKSTGFLYSNQKNILFVLMDIIVSSNNFSLSEKSFLMAKTLRTFFSLSIDFLKNRLSLALR